MTTTPTIAIYVRHSAGCKHGKDEFTKRCDCRKWLRWSRDGRRYRRITNTRSWAEAEQVKRDLEDQLTGRLPVTQSDTKTLRGAMDGFFEAKKADGLTKDVIGKSRRSLGRLASFCESEGVYTGQGVTDELLIRFCRGWPTQYPSILTRSKLLEQHKTFMRFCQKKAWISRLPDWPKLSSKSTTRNNGEGRIPMHPPCHLPTTSSTDSSMQFTSW